MNRLATLIVFVAVTVNAQQKCSKLTCPAGQEKVDDPNESNSKYCICQDAAPTCVIADCVTGTTVEADWMQDAACACMPHTDADPCDEKFAGAFKQANGEDCPPKEEGGDEGGDGGNDGGDGGSGAAHLTAGALVIAATLLF